MADDGAALGEQILNVAKAEMKAKIQPDGMGDDLGREAVAPIRRTVSGSATDIRRGLSPILAQVDNSEFSHHRLWKEKTIVPFDWYKEHELANMSKLILVAGHAVYIGDSFNNPLSDENWFLQSFQRGEPPFYVEHIRRGVELAAAHHDALLVFSGGQTRFEAGARSEAQSYWSLAQHFRWWDMPSVGLRATTEEFARDSLENLLFAICRFREVTADYPKSVEVVSWAFKEARFELHRAAILWKCVDPERDEGIYHFHGVNKPVSMTDAMRGEAAAVAAFTSDSFGTDADPTETEPDQVDPKKLGNKRRERNPFRRTPPYAVSCPDAAELLNHTTERGLRYLGNLPAGWPCQS